MGRVRGIWVAGLIALVAVPAVALAASELKPIAGTWTASFEPNPQPGGFVLAGDSVTSLTWVVGSGDLPSGCPTGSVTITGPLTIKYYKIAGSRPFWAFGKFGYVKIGHDRLREFEEAPVGATIDGQQARNVAVELEFDTDGTPTGKLVRAAGILDLKVNTRKPQYTSSSCALSIGEFRQSDHLDGH
jgi:hypothetical protein